MTKKIIWTPDGIQKQATPPFSPPPPPPPPFPSDRKTMVKKAMYYVHISSVVQVYTVYQLNQNRKMKRTFPEKLTQHSRRKYKYKGLEFAHTVLKHDWLSLLIQPPLVAPCVPLRHSLQQRRVTVVYIEYNRLHLMETWIITLDLLQVDLTRF